MPLPDIQLDDNNFETLVSNARRRIPGYTPEWTDFNESDPGITLMQLLAWLGEMILWRLNRVPEKNYIEFLKLIGIELSPPAPARAELTFTLSTAGSPRPGLPDKAVLIPAGTKVSTSESDADGPVIFETDAPLQAVGATLKKRQSFDGAQFKLLDQSNEIDGKFFYPFGPKPQPEAAFYIGFDRPFPLIPQPHVSPSYTLTIHAYTEDLIEEGQGIGADLAIPVPPVLAVWEYWAGDTVKWLPLRPDDTTSSLTRTGTVSFEAPVGAVPSKVGLLQKPDDDPLFWFRYRIDQKLGDGYEIAPRLEDVLINTVKARNVVTVIGELLGASDGSPNQTFQLANKPVLLDGFILEVDEPEEGSKSGVHAATGFQRWTRVDNFANSVRTDTHYVLNPATGEIAFGNGEQGKIPARLTDPSRPEEDLANIRASNYCWGGGARGNVGADKVTSLQSPVPYVASVTNFRPTSGGQDEESLDGAKGRAPQAIRTQSRAVTAEDFEFLAQQTPGARIRRARALPQHNPNLEPIRPAGAPHRPTVVPIPGAVTVMVVPESLSVKPVPSKETCIAVASWLNTHRLITTELYVVAPKYREVEIAVSVIVERSASSGQVAQTLNDRLLAYFHPLTGGTDGTGWEFGGTIYFSDTYRVILETPGVARLEVGAVTTYVDRLRIDPATDVILAENELVFSQTHQIFASYS
jgi:predicted phage baseplate assembly protein